MKSCPKVAFLGSSGSYSEEASYKFFNGKLIPVNFKTINLIFQQFSENNFDYAVVPIENSIEGSVNQTYDLLYTSKAKICGEVFLKIDHHLLANKGTKITQIKRVFSHQQAISQCLPFIEKNGFETIPYYDTASSAKLIASEKLMDSAAISSSRSAGIYDLQILKKDISINQSNYTRFIILSKNDCEPSGNDKTSIIINLKHVHSSLYHALGEFASRKINLTKIESRPIKGNSWEYLFYIDFEGNKKETLCRSALQNLKKHCNSIKILGSYKQAL